MDTGQNNSIFQKKKHTLGQWLHQTIYHQLSIFYQLIQII